MDARNYNFPDKLKDGTSIRIRAIRADDKQRVLEAFRNLEAESIRTRFFGYRGEPTDEELKAVTEVDFEKSVALVVTIPGRDGGETIIGAGRHILCGSQNPSSSAEIAFIVEEDYQGQGIASKILNHLHGIAIKKGVERFEAEVLAHNKGMLAVFARSGLPMVKSFEENIVHVTLSLT
ncbi:MAG: N-acetyltransferase family protein [Acidobacteriota bacterium]